MTFDTIVTSTTSVGASREPQVAHDLLGLAGEAERAPDDRFVDGVDQSSFLLASISDDSTDVVNPGGGSPASPRSIPTGGSTTCTSIRRRRAPTSSASSRTWRRSRTACATTS